MFGYAFLLVCATGSKGISFLSDLLLLDVNLSKHKRFVNKHAKITTYQIVTQSQQAYGALGAHVA